MVTQQIKSGRSVFTREHPSVPIIASSPKQLARQQLADRGLNRRKWCVRIASIVISACSSKAIEVDTKPIQVAFLKILSILIELTTLES